MKPFLITSLATAAALSAISAQAATISSASIVTVNDIGATTTSDSANDGTASVSSSSGFAIQNADGTSEVEANTGTRLFSTSKTTATAEFTQSETNSFGQDRDYTLSYSLTGQTANFFLGGIDVATARSVTRPVPTVMGNPFSTNDDPLTLPPLSQYTAASFEYNITVNGDLVFNARADALLNAFNPSGLIFDSVSEFTPSFVDNGFEFIFNVGAISGEIDLGTYADGTTLNVVSSLIARAYTPGGVVDGTVATVNTFSSDPVSLSSIGLSSVPSTTTPPIGAVPLPAAAWMLIAALGGLGAVRSRKA